MKLGARLKHARDRRKMTQEQLSQLASTPDVPISQAVISALEKRDSETTQYLFQFARALRINPEWLQTGRGDSGLDADAWRPVAELAGDEQDLLRDYRRASEAWQLTLRLMAKAEPDEQPQLSRDMNQLLGHVFGQHADDGRVRETLSSSRHGFPPGSVHQDRAGYDKDKKHKK